MNLSKIPVITKILKPCCRHYFKYTSPSPVCPPTAPYKFTVTLMDASTNMGQALALMLKQNSLVEELRLFDDKDTIGIGMDLSDIDTSTRILAYTGEENLTEALTEYRRAGVKVPEVKIIGAANYYSMRANHWIAKFMNVDAFHVTCPIVGGASPETAIAVMSGSNPGKKLTDPRILNAIQEGMAYGEERVLGITIHEEASSAAFAPAVAAYRLINKILKGLRGDEDTYDCAFVKQEGHLKKFLPYMTSIVKFGRHGVYDTHMPDMVGSELYRLKNSYPVLRAYIHLGEKYVHGVPLPPAKLPCNRPCILTKTKTVEDQRNPLKVKIHNPADYDKCGRIEERRDYGESCNS
ncbi:malate dehydrogenase, glyoxysomal-like isoform X2 [Coccinella septempunctata]|uniref:malate dehydrogenase, glyoxysomal-like isoform X2 n=1 Tax=Coccinella septempunctata TaxID=41139 RepID=UPI001D064DE8|nr:malate dehydrogenase, glyoxysomal-like isoform X2 [Coccinella septempunctata]